MDMVQDRVIVEGKGEEGREERGMWSRDVNSR